MIPPARLVSFVREAPSLALIMLAPLAGCVLITDVDERRIPKDHASSASSSGSSSASTGTGGQGGAGGASSCTNDADCPGLAAACGEPRCFEDGRCGFDNQPIGAPCDEGGAACDGKGHCVECTAGVHCASGKCGPDRTCIPATCSDTIENGDETDVDCGGSCVANCGPGAGCVVDDDCVGGLCEAGTCAPTCKDGAKNGEETGADCGGPTCPACPLGVACEIDADCVSGFCETGVCAAIPTCSDGAKNGAETDVDCGGPDCVKCVVGGACEGGVDCDTASCVAGVCAGPSCADGVQNGNEAGIDCGTVCPTGCAPGAPCTNGLDCASKICEGPAGSAVCSTPSCFDGEHNGDETSYDCGGSCDVKCPPFYPCLVHADCKGGVCDPVKLTCTPTCTDGYQNGGETDPDCGGPCPKKCPEGGHCNTSLDCVPDFYCFQGHCLP
ncbi:hypothetical protein [Polyangium mundeleinium]|uniref:Tryptophan synthase alpha chain n=1 Tax=Polyangium mundeleinium TaxID=2995306 RepID=A0ABT5EDK7_9BACT|nr:hypothetical protein [Polyangium mundeleinium]MDC0739903.1 hypothetical protein [Polyangium mundeleinium]